MSDKDLIERGEVKVALGQLTLYRAQIEGESVFVVRYTEAYEALNNISPVDARPVVKGEWIKEEDTDAWHCSCCSAVDAYAYCDDINHKPTVLQDNFCPNCGAEMKGEKN